MLKKISAHAGEENNLSILFGNRGFPSLLVLAPRMRMQRGAPLLLAVLVCALLPHALAKKKKSKSPAAAGTLQGGGSFL